MIWGQLHHSWQTAAFGPMRRRVEFGCVNLCDWKRLTQMNSNTAGKKQGPPTPNLRRAARLAAELRANLKKRKSACKTRDELQETPDSDGSASGE